MEPDAKVDRDERDRPDRCVTRIQSGLSAWRSCAARHARRSGREPRVGRLRRSLVFDPQRSATGGGGSAGPLSHSRDLRLAERPSCRSLQWRKDACRVGEGAPRPPLCPCRDRYVLHLAVRAGLGEVRAVRTGSPRRGLLKVSRRLDPADVHRRKRQRSAVPPPAKVSSAPVD